MAITIIDPNLSQLGNAGDFETDPSTWGFSNQYRISKDPTEHTSGLFSAKMLADWAFNASADFIEAAGFLPAGLPSSSLIARQIASVTQDKKYIATVNIKTPSSLALAPDDCIFQFTLSPGSYVANITIVSHVNKTIADCKDAWQTVVIQFQIAPGAPSANVGINLWCSPNNPATEHINNGGSVFIDQFRVYEYTDVISSCTLDIDGAATVVVDASGPLATDGSITVAITGGTGPYQYSKNDGVTWQVSNYFAGLANGIYPIKVMDADGCTSSESFSVNDAAAAFDFTLDKTDETISGAADGTITVTVTGAGGPYTFSKDGGVTYQAGNLFPDLPPGDYTIAVKDASGNIIAHNITILPGIVLFEKVWFSRNHIFYGTSANPGWEALTNVRIFNEVTLNKNDDGVYSSIPFKVDVPPDATGNVVFYNREAFTDALKALPPSLNANTIRRLTDRIKSFKNNTAQLQDTETDPPGATIPSNPHLVLLGGLSKYAWASIDFFGSYLPANKKFLTWAPVVKPVDKAQEDYLNYFIFDIHTATLKLRIKAYYDDGTNQTTIVTSLVGVQYGQLYQIPAGPSNTGAALINPAKNLIKYDLSLLDQDNSLISEVRTYVLDLASHPRKRLFMFLNSLGSYEVLRFTGVVEKGAMISKTEVAKFLPYNYNALDGEREMNDVALRESNSISSGLKDMTAAWLDYMKDLLLSRKFFDVTDGRRIPLMIQPGAFPMVADQNFEFFVRFSALDAYEDENYTPKNI